MSNNIIKKLEKFSVTEQAILLSTRKNLSSNENEYLQKIIKDDDMNWTFFLGYVFLNRVNGVAYKNLKRLSGIPKIVKFNLKATYENLCKRTKLHCKEILKIDKCFEKNGINYAFLKGAILNTIYYEYGERMSNDTDMLVDEADLKKIDVILKEEGYIQGSVKDGKVIPATKKEILFARMNTYETIPYVKLMDDASLPVHELDINFKLENGKSAEDAKIMLEKSVRIEKGNYSIRTLDSYNFLIFLCIHHYREATMMFKIVEGDDLTLYKYLDIHTYINQVKIDWMDFVKKTKEFNKEKEVYHTLWYTEHLYPNTVPENVFELFELDNTEFVNEYRGRDNTNEVYKWKMDFYERFFNEKRKHEIMENMKEESERFKSIVQVLKN